MNIKRYDLAVGQGVRRLLPWFVRGPLTQSLLIGIAVPLSEAHAGFLSWAAERLVEAVIGCHTMPMEWLLKHKLGKYFENPDDEFQVSTIDHEHFCMALWYFSETPAPSVYACSWLFEDDAEAWQHEDEAACIMDYGELDEGYKRFIITAPQFDTELVDYEEYSQQIRYWVNRYTVFRFKYIVNLKS